MAYVAGLVMTMSVMHIFGKAQPALLYLRYVRLVGIGDTQFDASHSPACILSLFITATVRGELRDVWNWSDDPEQTKKSKTSWSGYFL